MKKSIITLILLLPLLYVYSQGDEFTYIEANTRSWGGVVGLYMSKLSAGSDNPSEINGVAAQWDIDYSSFAPGFAFGLFVESKISGKLYFHLEGDFVRSQQKIDYVRTMQENTSTKYYADFDVNVSAIQIPLLIKTRFGNKIKLHLMGGPYGKIPFTSNNSGEIRVVEELSPGKFIQYRIFGNDIGQKPEKLEWGWMLGGGAKIPLNQSSFLVELRGGRSFNDVLTSPNYKNNFLILQIGFIKAL